MNHCQETRATTAAARGYDASWRGEGNDQKAGLPVASPESKFFTVCLM